MELGEAITALTLGLKNKDENFCDGKKHAPPQTGPNLIDGYTGTPTPENLLENMKKHNKRDGSPQIPSHPPKTEGSEFWDIEQCSTDTYPFQTHHIIPKKFLPEQAVCVWLTKEYTKHPEYQLEKDTKYSTDHSNNGYCLPFASTTYDWKKAASDAQKSDAAFRLMAKTKKQLHQGNHDKQDFDEQDDIELEGYLESIEVLLMRIHDAGIDHANVCEFCKQAGKKKVQPLDKTVSQVDLVSLITKLRIDANLVFVSQRAYDFYKAHG